MKRIRTLCALVGVLTLAGGSMALGSAERIPPSRNNLDIANLNISKVLKGYNSRDEKSSPIDLTFYTDEVGLLKKIVGYPINITFYYKDGRLTLVKGYDREGGVRLNLNYYSDSVIVIV